MERMARVPDGALDMIGPRTFDGGYSPSHVMSSAKSCVGDCVSILGAADTWFTREVCEAGTKACDSATMAARRKRVYLAMFLFEDLK